MNNDIKKYVEQIISIYSLLKLEKYPDDDVLVKLFHELMEIIFYESYDDLVTYSNIVYNINIPVDKEDILGNRIKTFILLYLNDAIPKGLEYEN